MGRASFKCLKCLHHYTRYSKNVQRGKLKNSGPPQKCAFILKPFSLFIRLIYKNNFFRVHTRINRLAGLVFFPKM